MFRLLAEETGATSVEYAFILALIVITCVAAIAVLGWSASDLFNSSNDAMNQAFGPR